MKLQQPVDEKVRQEDREWEPARPSRFWFGDRSPVERRNSVLAYGLLAAGLLLLSGRFGLIGGPGIAIMPGVILGAIAACFLFFAFWQRWYVLLIPGCILAGLALGVPLAPLAGGTPVLWGLALGFAAIYRLGSDFFGVRHPWPIFPAVPLFAVGAIIAVAQFSGPLATVASLWAPLVLIGVGLAYVYRRQTASQ